MQPSIGGFFETGKTDNSWHTFSANGKNWLVLALEWGPRDAVVQWADQVVTDHPDYETMVVTHAYMYNDDTIYDWATKGSSQSWNPHSYGIESLPGGVNDGEELWISSSRSTKTSTSFSTATYLETEPASGPRWAITGTSSTKYWRTINSTCKAARAICGVLEFKPDGDTVVVRTYSPVLDRYNTAADQQFTLQMSSTIIEGPPPIGHAVVGNLIAAGPTDPSANTVDSVTIPQASSPGVGTGQINRGDYEVTIGGANVTYNQGIMLASITQHDRPDFLNKRATVEVGRNSYGDGNLSLSVMQTGLDNHEVNFNTSIAWFPFDTGFRGAHVNNDGSLVPTGFNGVSQSMVTKTNSGRYTVDLGVNSQTSGMLFTIGNNNDNVIVQTGPAANGSNWDVRVTESHVDFAATGANTVAGATPRFGASYTWTTRHLA